MRSISKLAHRNDVALGAGVLASIVNAGSLVRPRAAALARYAVPATTKFAVCSHPRRPRASELTGCRLGK